MKVTGDAKEREIDRIDALSRDKVHSEYSIHVPVQSSLAQTTTSEAACVSDALTACDTHRLSLSHGATIH